MPPNMAPTSMHRTVPEREAADRATNRSESHGAARARAGWALALLLPAPTIGVVSAFFVFPGTSLGQGIYAGCKIWIFVIPLLFLLAERRRPAVSRLRFRDVLVGFGLGLAMAIAVVGAYLLAGRSLVDVEQVRAMARRAGLTRPTLYFACGMYWTLVNSLLEEYVWRWFVILCWQRFVSSGTAVVLAAVCFTAHHVAALSAWFDWPVVCLASAGVLTAGIVWGRLRRRRGSIWAAWISHVLADAAVFGLGGWMVFG